MKKTVILAILLSIVIGCKKQKQRPSYGKKIVKVEKSELLQNALNFFRPVNSSQYKKVSSDKIALGKLLYKDNRLSKDGNISCNSCHQLDNFGVDNLPKSPGDTKQLGGRNSPTSFYAALHSKQFWDGRAKDVEEQAGGPVLNPIEHNIPSESFLENRLRKIEIYQKMFKKAFPDTEQPITFKNIQVAIGAFERQLLPESKFDSYLNGNESSLNGIEKKGLQKFIDTGCIACHGGVALGGQLFQKFGVFDNYWEHTKSKKIDKGLYDLTKNEADKYVFKVPSLRNIEKTFPYFHDGSVESLPNTVKIMAKTQLNKDLNSNEIDNIVAFLKTLTADIDEQYK